MSLKDFWKTVIESRLLTREQCQALHKEYTASQPAQSSAQTLAEWLVEKRSLSRYQTKILLAGRSGPFFYGDYRVYDRIAQGQFSGRFRATHAPTSHPASLEFLTGPALQDAQQWRAAAQRCQQLGKLKHPHFAKVYEPVDLTQFKFAAVEDSTGTEVSSLLERGPLNATDAARIVRHAALALAAMHESGVIHGDIQPRSLLIDKNGCGRLLVAPFALPLGVQDDTVDRLQSRGDYLAPELGQPGKKPDALTDIYALGCVLYQLLSGSPPFAGGDLATKLQRHANEAIAPLEPFGVPEALTQVVAYMMAKNSEVRFQQAAVVAEQLAGQLPADQLQMQPTPVPASLPKYQGWIQQKQQAVSAPKTSQAVTESAPTPMIVADTSPTARIIKKPAEGGDFADTWLTKKNITLLAAGLGGFAVLLIGLVIMLQLGGDKPDEVGKKEDEKIVDPGIKPLEKKDNGTPSDTSNGQPKTTGSGASAQVVVKDDGALLWASPTTGEKIDFSYVPMGARIFLHCRPAEIVANPRGEQVLSALGPDFASARKSWETVSGFTLSDVEQMVVSFHDNSGGRPRVHIVSRLKAAQGVNELLAKWGNPAAKNHEGKTYYETRGWAIYVPTEENGSLFTMGSPDEIKICIETGGAPPTMRRELGQLRDTSDSSRHVSLLLTPNYLFSDGEKLFSGSTQRISEPLEWFFGDGLQATSFSMHLGDQFYIEMRLISQLGRDRVMLAQEFRDRINEIPGKIRDYVALRLNPPDYWRKLSFAFPAMITRLHLMTRVGDDDGQTVLNAVLHPSAASNMALAAELTMAQTPGAVAIVGTPTESKTPKTIQELLNHRTSMSFSQKSLEFAMADIATDIKEDLDDLPFNFQVKIVGADLEKDGLTRNQQIRGVSEKDKTVAEILTAVVVTAMATGEPITAPSQKMIWVVGPNPENASEQIILVTTRKAAAEKGYTVPKVFTE